MPAHQNRQSRRSVDKAVRREAQKAREARTADKVSKRGGATSAAAWRQGQSPVYLTLPSGNVCRAINKGMQAFMKAGKIPNSLMPIIDKALAAGEGKGLKDSDIGAEILEDPELLNGAFDLINIVVCECVIEPTILPIPLETHMHPADKDHPQDWSEEVEIPVEDRDEDHPVVAAILERHGVEADEALWVDETDLDDRLFVLNWAVGGTQDLEQFRDGVASTVERIRAINDPESEAE